MLPTCVTHMSGHVSMYATVCKEPSQVISQMQTVGYRPLNTSFNSWQRKPFTKREAEPCGCADKKSLQECFEDGGEYKISPHVYVDCTPLHRLYDSEDIHNGEHSNVIVRMVHDPFLAPLLRDVKIAFAKFLRDRNTAARFDCLFFDPYGQCRSVAFARIVTHCLAQCDVQVINSKHHSQESWQQACCKGDFKECTHSPMSEAKTAALRRAYAIWLGA